MCFQNLPRGCTVPNIQRLSNITYWTQYITFSQYQTVFDTYDHDNESAEYGP